MSITATRSTSFGRLLREWRQRRRLSQLELGLQSEVSARHLSFLETGRARPSREMVLHLSEELDVPLRTRNTLLVAAGFAPAYSQHRLDDADMAHVREALDVVLAGHEPYPAVIVDQKWDLVAGNQALSLFTELIAPDLLAPPVNVIRASVHPEGLARHLANFDEYAGHLVARLRRQVERSADPELASLLEEAMGHLRSLNLDLSATPADRVVLPIRLRHPDGELALFSTIALFGAPLDVTLDELAIESFFPADPATAAYLRRRAGIS